MFYVPSPEGQTNYEPEFLPPIFPPPFGQFGVVYSFVSFFDFHAAV
jgi:hypothetical protein